MSATKYQVLYRYVNPSSNQFITNDLENEYNKVFELYHDEHKIEIGTPEEVLTANNEKSSLIIDGNSTANDNYNMLFKFTGTKRINKKVWKPKTTGYVIRDKKAVRELTTRAVDGDFTGNYLLMEGDSIENGIVVAKNNPVIKPISITQEDSANKIFFVDDEELLNTIINKTIAKLTSDNPADYGTLKTYVPYTSGEVAVGGVCDINIKVGYDFALQDIQYRSASSSYTIAKKALSQAAYTSVSNNKGVPYSTVTISSEKVETYEIPAHYEEVADYPYVVCDTYEQIEQSPWFILSTHGSITSALEKAKAVVKSVGINNVKLIKVVPTEQFIKIN